MSLQVERLVDLAPSVATELDGHEGLWLGTDSELGYRGLIAIHSTRLGPAIGGTRLWRYQSMDDAIRDVLRLSSGMTYKNAVAGIPFGGGKSVILADGRENHPAARKALLRSHGRFIQTFGGRYYTGEDVNTRPEDMDIVLSETPYVAGTMRTTGDPSPTTAWGVFRAMQAAARSRWGSDNLFGKSVAVQGAGSVGSHLARHLHEAGASVVIADLQRIRAEKVGEALGATVVASGEIHEMAVDIFSPCAMGGALNETTIPGLEAAIVVGGANNQLATERDDERLAGRGILYVPDFVANAGGVIKGVSEFTKESDDSVERRVDGIYHTVLEVLRLAHERSTTPQVAALALARLRLSKGMHLDSIGYGAQN